MPPLTRSYDGPIDLIVDSTGLKILGCGEWNAHKHKASKKRRDWRKLHIGVDAEGFIVAAELTRRESVVWSGALRLRPIKRSSESRNPSVWRSGRLKTTRSVNAVRTARFEYRRWPPRRPFFGGTHAAIASSLSQIVTSPRLLRPRSYSLQFRILYFFLYWRLTRLDFAATTTLPPPDLYDGLDPTPAASVLAYTDSCTNAFAADQTAISFTVTATPDTDADGGESVRLGFGTLPDGVFAGSPAAAVTLMTMCPSPSTNP